MSFWQTRGATWWDWVEGFAVFLAGIVAHAGASLIRGVYAGGQKSKQFETFGDDLKEIKKKVDRIPKLESDVRAVRQALLDNGIKIANGEH